MLIAQALAENRVIVSNDVVFDGYGVSGPRKLSCSADSQSLTHSASERP